MKFGVSLPPLKIDTRFESHFEFGHIRNLTKIDLKFKVALEGGKLRGGIHSSCILYNELGH